MQALSENATTQAPAKMPTLMLTLGLLLGQASPIWAANTDKKIHPGPAIKLRADSTFGAASPYRLSVARSDYRIKPSNIETQSGKRKQLGRQIEQHAHAQGLDPALVNAVVRTESAYRVDALSPKGAIGLMQVMPATGERFGVRDLENTDQNLRAGTTFLRHLLNRYDDLPLALAAYNAGEGAVEKYGNRVPPYPETQSYVSSVMRHYREQAFPGSAVQRHYIDGARLDGSNLMQFRLLPTGNLRPAGLNPVQPR